MKKHHGLLVVAALLMAVLVMGGCDSAGAGAGPSVPRLNALLSSIPVTSASLPESVQRASGDAGVSSLMMGALSAEPYDSSAQVGVMGFIMKDLLYNWLLDLALVDYPGVTHIFLTVLREVALDPSVTLSADAPIRIGERLLPPNELDAFEELTSMDFGSFIITEPSPNETEVYWSLLFHGAPVFIHLTIEGSSSDRNATTRIYSEVLDLFVYEEFGAGGKWITYNFSEGEISTFQQYTDSNGRLRTLFNADINGRYGVDGDAGDPEYYQLLFLMIGDGDIAGIDAFTRDERLDRSVQIGPETEARRTRETYNENGQLIVAEHVGDELQPFRYPMMMLARNGYTLMRDENTLTWDSDGGALPEGGTVVEAVNTYEYQIWTGGKNFANQPVDIFQTDVAVEHLDAQPKIDAVQEALSSWMTDLTEAHGINGTTNILTFNPDEEELLEELGRADIISHIGEERFPVPNP